MEGRASDLGPLPRIGVVADVVERVEIHHHAGQAHLLQLGAPLERVVGGRGRGGDDVDEGVGLLLQFHTQGRVVVGIEDVAVLHRDLGALGLQPLRKLGRDADEAGIVGPGFDQIDALSRDPAEAGRQRDPGDVRDIPPWVGDGDGRFGCAGVGYGRAGEAKHGGDSHEGGAHQKPATIRK